MKRTWVAVGAGVVGVAAAAAVFVGMVRRGRRTRAAFAAMLGVETDAGAAYRAAEGVMEQALGCADAVAAGRGEVVWSEHAAAMPQGEALAYGEYGSAEAFEGRMMRLYDALVAGEVRAWEDAGAPPRWAEAWRWREYVAQLAPFNLVDGAWLAGTASVVGPTHPVGAALHAIHYDETGNGVVAHNHATVYLALLDAMGLVDPAWRAPGGSGHAIIGSPAFASSPAFLDAAFDNAALQLAASLFPLRYHAEICGFTLWLEFFASPINARLAREAAPFLPDTVFFRLHGAIDNVAAGHGRQALDAVHALLEPVAPGPAREALFRRVWRGFVAFQTTMDTVMAALDALDAPLPRPAPAGVPPPPSPPPPARQWSLADATSLTAAVDALLVAKAAFAKDLHGDAVVGGGSLNAAFAAIDDGNHAAGAAALRTALAASPHVIPGAPHASALVTTLVNFRGPMYCIFSDDELALLTAWIASLGADADHPPAGAPASAPIDYSDASLAASMAAMLGEARAAGSRAHRPSTSLGARPLNAVLADSTVTNDELVRILAADAPARAAFAAALQPGRPMARALGRYAGLVARWEAAGCPTVASP